MATNLDIRQSQTRTLQDQLNSAAVTQMDSTLASINSEATPLCRLIAQSTPSLVVSVGSGTVANPNTSKNRTLPLISNIATSFAGGTITFPSGSGTITTSTSTSASITIGASQFCAVLVQLDSTGAIQLVVGTPAGSFTPSIVPAGSSSFFSIGYIVVQTNGSSVIQSITNAMLYQFDGSGSSGGSGSGSGTGDDLDSLQFRASFSDLFTENSANANTSVNSSGTNAVYNAGKQMYALSYDASKTASTSGTTVTMSGAPSFTVAIGDQLISGGVAKKITAVASQTSYTIESAFSSNLASAAVTVSQCVYTKDIYNLAVDGAALSAGFAGQTFSEVLIDYKDNNSAGSNLFTPNVGPYISYTASNDNSTFTTVNTRQQSDLSTYQSVTLASAGTALYLRFFANQSSGSGVVNLITYKAFMQKSVTAAGTNNVLWSAYGTTNSSTTPINCSVSVVGGKTTITFTNGNSYPVGTLSGQAIGSLSVAVDGKVFSRFVSSSTPSGDGYYTEVSPTVIQLDRDYSSQQLEFLVVYSLQVIDSSTTNTSAISAIQEADTNGFQAFVNQSNSLVATTVTGTPVAGTFYSSITNRASLVDFTQDLKPRMGIERITFQQISQIQNESGPNGEAVWGTPNDLFGQIRFVGNWSYTSDTLSSHVDASGVAGDYMEITFYGTGLNVLAYSGSAARTINYSVDGGSNTNFWPSNMSNVIGSRNYATMQVFPVVNGLSLGIHTIKITNGTALNWNVYGFDVLNESSSIKVNPGISYVGGKKLTLSSQNAFSYSAPVTGTRGGRVLVYQKSDGTIGTAFQAVNASQQNLTSADHTNEEVVRSYNIREFGAGRSDDFSSITNGDKAFTLDDDTGTFVATNATGLSSGSASIWANTTNNFYTVTFVGTGLDMIESGQANSTYDQHTVFVDGTSIGTITGASTNVPKLRKIVSGLPYGSHTVRIRRDAAVNDQVGVYRWVVYQPKKPTLPAGATELCDYNVMANYTAPSSATSSTAAAVLNVSSGVLRKMSPREFVYSGTWSSPALDASATNFESGWNINTSTAASYAQFTFFGTAFEIGTLINSSVTAANVTISVDGSSNLSGFTTALIQPGTGLTFTASTGTITGTSSAGGTGQRARYIVSNMPLALHTVKVTFNSGLVLFMDSVDVVTPIHSYKYNIYADLQNTLSVGSNAISDNRKLTPVKDVVPATKAWAQAIGVTGSPSTSSTNPVPMPDMSCTIKTTGGAIQVSWTAIVYHGTNGGHGQFQIYVDGFAVGTLKDVQLVNSGGAFPSDLHDDIIVPVSPGFHKVDVYWFTSAGTLSSNNAQRNMSVREL